MPRFTIAELREFKALLIEQQSGGDLTRFPWLEFEGLANKWNAVARVPAEEQSDVDDEYTALFEETVALITRGWQNVLPDETEPPTTFEELEKHRSKDFALALMTGTGLGELETEHNLARMKREYDAGKFYYDTPEALREYAGRQSNHYKQRHEQVKQQSYRVGGTQEAANAALDTAYREIQKHILNDLPNSDDGQIDKISPSSSEQPKPKKSATEPERSIESLDLLLVYPLVTQHVEGTGKGERDTHYCLDALALHLEFRHPGLKWYGIVPNHPAKFMALVDALHGEGLLSPVAGKTSVYKALGRRYGYLLKKPGGNRGTDVYKEALSVVTSVLRKWNI